MNYEKSLEISKSLKTGVQVKFLSAQEYIMFLNMKRNIAKFLVDKDSEAQQLINEYNSESPVVTIDENGMLRSMEPSFYEKISAIRSVDLEVTLNFIDKIEVFKSVFENCSLESQELLFEYLYKH